MEANLLLWKLVEASMGVDLLPRKYVEFSMEVDGNVHGSRLQKTKVWKIAKTAARNYTETKCMTM